MSVANQAEKNTKTKEVVKASISNLRVIYVPFSVNSPSSPASITQTSQDIYDLQEEHTKKTSA